MAFVNRPPPPHMNGGFDNAAPLLHLPLSAGGAGPRDGAANVLSVAAPQPQHPFVNAGGVMAGMGGAPGGVPPRGQNGSPQQNLLARLGILPNQQERKPSPKNMDGPMGGFDRAGMPNDLRMPMPQQHYGAGPPSALNRGAYGSPVDDRFEPAVGATMSNDGRYPLGQGQGGPSAASSNFGPSPVGGSNPAHNLAAKGSRLAKFFEKPRGAGDVSPASMHSSGMGSMDGSISGRGGIVTPPYQFENNNKNQGIPDLLALLQSSSLQGSQSQVSRIF